MKRRRTITLKVKDNMILITCPYQASEEYINNIYIKYRRRLLEKLKASKTNENEIKLFGRIFAVEKVENPLLKRPFFEIKNNIFVENIPFDCDKTTVEQHLTKWKIEKIRKIIFYKVIYFNRKFNFSFNEKKNSIRIKGQKSLWGSCSHNNNLNFNYKIIERDNKTIDYLVLHELTHTIHKNHSTAFWECLKEVCPDCINLKSGLD
ncbi:MAG: M48 family metallopeptidase [Rickettsiales bacterium]|nr:M48 family metallopeptidase [Rickettsiales bacterium]